MTPAELENYVPRLAERLKEHGISKSRFARELEVDPAQVARWFRYPLQISLRSMLKIEYTMERITRQDAEVAEPASV